MIFYGKKRSVVARYHEEYVNRFFEEDSDPSGDDGKRILDKKLDDANHKHKSAGNDLAVGLRRMVIPFLKDVNVDFYDDIDLYEYYEEYDYAVDSDDYSDDNGDDCLMRM